MFHVLQISTVCAKWRRRYIQNLIRSIAILLFYLYILSFSLQQIRYEFFLVHQWGKTDKFYFSSIGVWAVWTRFNELITRFMFILMRTFDCFDSIWFIRVKLTKWKLIFVVLLQVMCERVSWMNYSVPSCRMWSTYILA